MVNDVTVFTENRKLYSITTTHTRQFELINGNPLYVTFNGILKTCLSVIFLNGECLELFEIVNFSTAR